MRIKFFKANHACMNHYDPHGKQWIHAYQWNEGEKNGVGLRSPKLGGLGLWIQFKCL